MADYGNVPVEDVAVVQNAPRIAANVVNRMPLACPLSWKDVAFELVLDGVLRDWVENGTTELDEGDEDDLSNLLKLAADTALALEASNRDAAFRVLLKQVMADWVENWNAED
jgi:hypothetical protein